MAIDKLILICRIGLVLCGIGVVVCGYLATYYYPKQKELLKAKEDAMDATLAQKPKVHVPNLSSDGVPALKHVFIQLGTIKMVTSGIGLSTGIDLKPFIMLNGSGLIPLTIKYVDDSLLVTTKLFGTDGKLTGELVDNEWSGNQPNGYKRNYDDTAAEVIDERDHVVFFAGLIKPNLLVIQGIFFTPDNQVIIATNNTTTSLSTKPEDRRELEGRMHKPWSQILSDYAHTIPRRFKYGNDSFGKRATLN